MTIFETYQNAELIAVSGFLNVSTPTIDPNLCKEKTIMEVVIYGVGIAPNTATRSDGHDLTQDFHYDPDYKTMKLKDLGLDFCDDSLQGFSWE